MTLHRDTIPTVESESNVERKKIVAAMRRLLITRAPSVVSSDAKLVIQTLADEAGVHRAALSHRHIDLKDLFLACTREQSQEASDTRSDREKELDEELAAVTAELAETKSHLTSWRNAARDLARTVAALDALYRDEKARRLALTQDGLLDDLDVWRRDGSG